MLNTFFGAALAAVGLAITAQAAMVTPGLYQLANHPDGAERPPLYGLRLDELYNATTSHDVYSFNFSAVGSDVKMLVTASTIRIYGSSVGGRDIGTSYAADIDAGTYTFDFLYNVGVGTAAGDDDRIVIANQQNFGTITTPRGDTINLTDQSLGGYSFRLGDEDNDAGHRGFAGISGWGWMNHGSNLSQHVSSSDWLFTAQIIPTPSSLALLAMGGLMAGRRRR